MAIYTCQLCGNFRDSDDGCHENPEGKGLVCHPCMNDWLENLPECLLCGSETSVEMNGHDAVIWCVDGCKTGYIFKGQDEIQAVKRFKELYQESIKTEDDYEMDFVESQERYYK